MKKAFLLLGISLAFIACDKDDDNVDVLVGTWYPESIIINGQSKPYEGNANCGRDYLVLSKFHSFEIVDYSNNENAAKTTPVPPCPSQKYYGSYSVVNNELKFYGSNFFQGGTIIEKTNSHLQLKRVLDINGDGKNDEVIELFYKIVQE